MNNSIKTSLITGASNGIGLDLTKKLIAEGIKVIAVTRSGEVAGFSHPNLTVMQGDISNEESIAKVAKQVAELGISIDCLINNAGVLVDANTEVPTAAGLNASFATNTVGTALFTEALLNNVTDGGQIIFLSTIMSLLRAAAPDAPGYRMSKAALNMYVVMLSERLTKRNIRVTALHPGWVQTRMGGQTAPTTIEQSVNGIYKAITENTAIGKFWNVDSAGIENY
ncbi:SDR family NAD(P)-dependent oxidoreductase [Mucilaginibacter calamicampi]|uniref:SDR family NAD(P)-dependent oxidoreductase n=1 Tax=Mucilaginibacter calamicampi TaxID=1302352 RepID=A0ABW2Z2C2_9SPHI